MKDLQTLLDDFIESNYGEASNDDIARYFYELGQKNMRAKMMEGAVEGEIQMRYSGALCAKTIHAINEDEFKLSDKVRIIILPKEGEK